MQKNAIVVQSMILMNVLKFHRHKIVTKAMNYFNMTRMDPNIGTAVKTQEVYRLKRVKRHVNQMKITQVIQIISLSVIKVNLR